MKRRELLKLGAMTLLTGGGVGLWAALRGGSPLFGARVSSRASRGSWGRDPARPRTVIIVFLAGGMDGLNAVAPYQDPRYQGARPKLALPAPGRAGGVLDLDGAFGLNPALGPLLPLFREGTLAFVQAVGTPCTDRSHLWCERYLETAGDPSPEAPGWLNRYARRVAAGSAIPCLTTAYGVPAMLRGEVPTLSLSGLHDLRGRSDWEQLPEAMEALRTGPQAPLQRVSSHTFNSEEVLRRLRVESYSPAVEYPPSSLSANFELLAFLIKSGIDLRVAHVEQSGYDTHANQVGGALSLDRLFADLAGALAAFWQDLGELQDQVVLLTFTEFGRRLKENGTLGTDHGWASCSMLLGGSVRGGKVHGRWPGLEPDQLFEGIDLPVTTDFRDLFLEVAGDPGEISEEPLFEGHEPAAPLGLLRS